MTTRKVYTCKRCQKVVPRLRTYCDECWTTRKSWTLQDKIDKWLSGDASIASGSDGELARWARTYLVKEAGEKCTECGWNTPNPVRKRPILTIDHIDGNWKNNCRDNLVVLCFNCHTLTPTFGNLNRGTPAGNRTYIEGSRHMKSDRPHRNPKKVVKCIDCDVQIDRKATRCNYHNRKFRGTKIEWPDEETLVNSLTSGSYSKVGRELGVSDNAVRKHMRSLGYDPKSLVKTIDISVKV